MLMRSAVLAVVLVMIAGGCGAKDTPRADSVVLSENLCQQLPTGVVDAWSLSEVSHETVNDEARSRATCRMTGTRDGEPVTLDVDVTSFGGVDDAAATDAMTEGLTERCGALEQSAVGTFEDEVNRCSVTSPATPRDRRGEVTEISRALGGHAVVEVSMTHAGESWRLVGADVVAVSAEFSSRGRDEWVP